MEKYVKPLTDPNIPNDDSEVNGVFFCLIGVLATLGFISFYHILLTGLSTAGKMLIIAHLLHSKFVNTYVSTEDNEDFIMNKHTFKLVDIPGHERLCCRYSNQFKLSAKELADVIDLITCQKDVRDAAEYLYNIHII